MSKDIFFLLLVITVIRRERSRSAFLDSWYPGISCCPLDIHSLQSSCFLCKYFRIVSRNLCTVKFHSYPVFRSEAICRWIFNKRKAGQLLSAQELATWPLLCRKSSAELVEKRSPARIRRIDSNLPRFFFLQITLRWSKILISPTILGKKDLWR